MYTPTPIVKKSQVIPEGPAYEPPVTRYSYDRIRPLGYLGGPIPMSNVVKPAFESFGYALALIAIGTVIVSIGLAFLELVIPPLITGILGGALILTAPFF